MKSDISDDMDKLKSIQNNKIIYIIAILLLIVVIYALYFFFGNYEIKPKVYDSSILPNSKKRIANNYNDIVSRNDKKFKLTEKNPDYINLDVRNSKIPGENKSLKTIENNSSRHVNSTLKVDKNRIAVIIVDLWEFHPNGGWFFRAQDVAKEKILPLISTCRKNNIPIVFATYDYIPLSQLVKVQENELYSDNIGNILNFLDKNNINTLVFAGFSTNYCLLFRPAGVINMSEYYNYKSIIIRDATIAYEMPETFEKELSKKVAIDIIETYLGYSTTLQDFEDAINNKQVPAK